MALRPLDQIQEFSDPLASARAPSAENSNLSDLPAPHEVLSPFAPLIDPMFLLASEVSCIYTQGGRGEAGAYADLGAIPRECAKINKEMTRQGCNLLL